MGWPAFRRLVAFTLMLGVASSPPWDVVVRIEVAAVAPSYLRPWEKAAQQRQGGTGFLVAGQRILTNHHVIENAVDIRLSKTGNSKRWRARVSAVGPDVDLATLEVIEDADSFLRDMAPVTWSDELPALQSRSEPSGFEPRARVAAFLRPSTSWLHQLAAPAGCCSLRGLPPFDLPLRQSRCVGIRSAVTHKASPRASSLASTPRITDSVRRARSRRETRWSCRSMRRSTEATLVGRALMRAIVWWASRSKASTAPRALVTSSLRRWRARFWHRRGPHQSSAVRVLRLAAYFQSPLAPPRAARRHGHAITRLLTLRPCALALVTHSGRCALPHAASRESGLAALPAGAPFHSG